MRTPPQIIKNMTATVSELEHAGIVVLEDGSRQWVGNMSTTTLYKLASTMMKNGADAIQKEVTAMWGLAHAVNGEQAEEEYLRGITAAESDRELLARLQAKQIWRAIDQELTERGLKARW